jgi:hypothetical protein
MQHQDLMKAVTQLVGTVSELSTNMSWMKNMGKWVMGLCVSVVCLVIVGIFYAGAMWQQVQHNGERIEQYHMTTQGAQYVQEQEGQIHITLLDQLLF